MQLTVLGEFRVFGFFDAVFFPSFLEKNGANPANLSVSANF
jgi:hypothetical protein